MDRNRISACALPTLNLPQLGKEKNVNGNPSVSTQTKSSDQNALMNIIRNKDNYQSPIYIKTVTTLKSKLDNLSKTFSSKEFTELIKCAEKLSDSKESSCYVNSYRQYCLNLYCGDPRSYRLLQKAVRLPNPRQLLNNMPFSTEINKQLLKVLKVRLEHMSVQDIQCMLVIDSMPITRHVSYSEEQDKIIGFHEINGNQNPFLAERVLVMMLHGMVSEWQLPIGYAFLLNLEVDGVLGLWMSDVIKKLFDIGLAIRTVTVASEFEAEFFERRWINSESPYFFVQKKKVYFISDPKIMLNALRNDLSLYNVQYDIDRIAKYEYIEEFYNIDKDSQFRLAPKLTKEHISPSDSSNACAIELFSKTVASGLSTYIDCKLINEEARGTVELIVKIYELIALFNTANDVNCNNRIFGDARYRAMELLEEMDSFFKNIKLLEPKNKQDVTDSSTFIRGFLVNIKSYLSLLNDLIEERYYTHMPVKILNQGLTEDFFRNIRARCEEAAKPTAIQFAAAYKQLFILELLKPLKGRRNTKEDKKNFFHLTKRAIKEEAEPLENQDELLDMSDNEKITISLSDLNHIDRTERHTLLYVSGYLLKKCKEQHKECPYFSKYVEGTSENITINHVSRYLLYSQKCQICFMAIPCNHFIVIVEQLENVFRSILKNNIGKRKLEEQLYEDAKLIDFGVPPCPCFPWHYLMKLFFKVRINYTLMLNNKEFERGQNRFVIPLLLSNTYAMKLPE